ncbi:MAG TPA: HXXEE domain-containing protein [Bryobacteraceae bacterium]|nr:HXXEE domain-containing protein [Bryobacteraceae bacterium]
MSDWLYRHWVPAALCMAIFLLLLAAALSLSWDLPVLMIYLQIPIYMLHQVEEHTGDRFRQYVNLRFGGVEALTPNAVLVTNIPGVWGLGLLSIYAALLFGMGWGLAIVYLVLLNALIHIVSGIAARAYNPGLWTALALFLPVGGFALWLVSSAPGIRAVHHLVGLAIAIAIHIALVVHTGLRARSLKA